ncbi:hypothetical protein LINGRAHAP2_LOCUS20229, partial [Linum grandiflorum]
DGVGFFVGDGVSEFEGYGGIPGDCVFETKETAGCKRRRFGESKAVGDRVLVVGVSLLSVILGIDRIEGERESDSTDSDSSFGFLAMKV